MAQQFDYPKTEIELQSLLDKMYIHTRQIIGNKDTPKIKGLYEIITSETVIQTAIHNIKAVFREINDINSTIRGIIQYYQVATFVCATLAKYASTIRWAAYKALKGYLFRPIKLVTYQHCTRSIN
ncbi:hypothetical protein [Sporomusa malonica]|uniref:Uncharacterized protein n=1 Tax=Sporomusa malonica TaxID=112901 RepID=A0A1W2CYA1_9FIRM|nr:hypothetical protein [Sporomusa malonica]SMC90217.1 hypothetical protein SAMN04488500_112115 [Sporomusa malonica]